MVRISDLEWDARNEEHVARHAVEPEEVEEATHNDHYVTRARDNLFRVIGQTDAGRYLTIYVAPRDDGSFYPVTARDATPGERREYRQRVRRKRW